MKLEYELDPPDDPPEPDFSTLQLPIEKGEWRDADERMFLACFEILGEYVQEELGLPWNDGDACYRGYRLHASDMAAGECGYEEDTPSTDRAAIDLWLWYSRDLPVLERDHYNDHNGVGFIAELVKQEKLLELIAMRRNLWT